jgi:hypothetical protein
VELTVELGVGTQTSHGTLGLWDQAAWDNSMSGTWSGIEPSWLPVDPCRLLDVSTTRGRDRWIDRFGASSASFSLQDPDGRLSWDSQDDDDMLVVRPGREVRVTARLVSSGETFPVWRGWVETIEDEFVPGQVPAAKFTAQDSYASLAHINFLEQDPVGAGETSNARIHRLLDLAEWPAAWRDVDAGRTTVQGTNLARAVADDLGITADSEGGAVYADMDGRIAFRNRDWLRTNPASTSLQATVGGADQDVCAASFETTRNADDIVNDVQVARATGTVQQFLDPASISTYRRRTYQRTDYVCDNDDQVAVLGRRILGARATGQVRIPKVTITPTDSPADWRFVLTVDYGWRLEVHYPTTDGTDWTRTVLVQGITHNITPAGWTTELRVDDLPPGMESGADWWDGPRGWDEAVWSVVV